MFTIMGLLGLIGVGSFAANGHAQFIDFEKFKKRFEKPKKEADKVNDAIDKVDDARGLVDQAKDLLGGEKEDTELDALFKEVTLTASAYNRCSDFTIAKGKSTVTLSGATNNLKNLRKDLPKTDLLRSNTIIEIPEKLCSFVVNSRRLQDPKEKKTPAMKGPGRQQVSDENEKMSVKIRFDYDKAAEFARFYYLEWHPESFVAEFIDLKDEGSRKEFFGRSEIPISKGGEFFNLLGRDGPISLYGYGPRMIVLVQSNDEIRVNVSTPAEWMSSLQKMQKNSKVEVAVTWLELYAP